MIQIYIKKPSRFHNLQTFIYQCSRIDCNLLSHYPVWMLQGIFQSYFLKVSCFLSTERTAGGSDQQFMYLLSLLSVKRLENCAVLAVYRQNLYTELFRQRHDQMTCCHQCFFICQCNVLACKDCFHGRSDSDHSHDSCDQNIRFLHSRKFDQTAHLAYDLYIQILYSHRQISGCFFFPDRYQFRMKFTNLFLQHFHIASCRKADYFQVCVCTYHIQRLCSDRASGT